MENTKALHMLSVMFAASNMNSTESRDSFHLSLKSPCLISLVGEAIGAIVAVEFVVVVVNVVVVCATIRCTGFKSCTGFFDTILLPP